jgi:hypothetical protein
MKTKIFSLLILSILALALLPLVNATITLSTTTPSNLEQTTSSFNITVTSDQNETVNLTTATITEGGKSITFDQVGVILNETDPTQQITINYTVDPEFEFKYGKTYSTTITASGDISDNKTQTITFAETDFCETCANPGEIEIVIEDINVKEGFGDDDEYWYVFDKIEAEIEVKNEKGDWDVENIEFEWALYTTGGKKVLSDDESDFDLDTDDDKTITITFELDEDIDDFEGEDAVLYVRAKGKIDDSGESHDNYETCDWVSQEIEMTTNDDFIIINDFIINAVKLENMELTETIACGEELQIAAEVWNIGDDKQEDVFIVIYNQELKINQKVEIGDINGLDSEDLDTTMTFPQDIEAKNYFLQFKVYNEDNDLYETNKEEDKSQFNILVKVNNNSCSTTTNSGTSTTSGQSNSGASNAAVSVDLESGGEAGEELIVKTTIINPSDSTGIYSLSIEGYGDWASLTSISSSNLVLLAGESKDVTLKFNVDKDASGDKTFKIDVISGEKVIITQPVSVSIDPAKNLILDKFNGLENNWFLWTIVLLNAVVIITIIFVVVKSKKQNRTPAL